MKKTFVTNLVALALASGIISSCGGDAQTPAEKTGTTNTEDMVEGVDGGLDSLDLSADTTTSSGSTGQGNGQ
ncbi:hypothetical protein [Rufibacter sp. XAAS-G3-1]|uniref:hypothetical protein n=1 Tax=Rufibacter sp. XAAS-G3-1 TaxID=2729134 RepID=UPI0015E66691|nr:hypothetical protein [Rufibacter sp. XAAS-G3-1]